MPRKERIKKLKAKRLNEAGSSTPKLSTFGFVKTSSNSSQTQNSNNLATNLDAEDFSSYSHESESPAPGTMNDASTENLNFDAEDSSLHLHELDIPDTDTIENEEKLPDPPFTQHQSTFLEKLASNLPQEMMQSLEPTIVDHDSETDISEPPFDITSASPITRQST